MPVKIGGKTFEHFKQAAAWIRRSKKKNKKGQAIRDPNAYVASIERKQGLIK